MAQFRIDYTITRREDGEADFTEIGFGSSGARGDVDQCAYQVDSAIQNREWETSEGMPDPDCVDERSADALTEIQPGGKAATGA